MFWNKIKTSEYLELLQKYEALRIRVEGIILDLQLTKAKLRAKKGIQEEEKEEKKSSILLSPEGEEPENLFR